jgi:hypothetical protein
VHELEIGVRRHEILADPFDCPASHLRLMSGFDQWSQYGPDRVGENHAGLRRLLRHVAPDAGQRPARADADHDSIDVALHLAKDLRASRGLVRVWVGGVGELIDEQRAGRALGDRLSEVLIVVGMAAADVGARKHHFGAHRLAVQNLLARHLVRHDEYDPIALARADQGEPQAGIAGCGLDDRASGFQAAVGFGRLDHRARGPVLDRA